jgi:hypothetical protein
MKLAHIILLGSSVTLLTACGGGGGSGASFESISSKGLSLLATYGTAPVTDVANMPSSGTANYTGTAAYSTVYSTAAGIAQNATSVSDVSLVADFANSTMSGSSQNFKSYDPNISMSGRINVNGNITGNEFSAAVNGTVTESGYGLTIPVNYSGAVGGVFVGTNADAVRGLGSATGDLGIYGSDVNVNVLWGAERQ